MTRKEQILQDKNVPGCYVDRERKWVHEAFMDGVDWADENPSQESKVTVHEKMSAEEQFQLYLQKRELEGD